MVRNRKGNSLEEQISILKDLAENLEDDEVLQIDFSEFEEGEDDE